MNQHLEVAPGKFVKRAREKHLVLKYFCLGHQRLAFEIIVSIVSGRAGETTRIMNESKIMPH